MNFLFQVFFLCSIVFTSAAYAENFYAGTIRFQTSGKISLIDENKTAYLIKTSNKALYSNLMALESGDAIMLTGDIAHSTIQNDADMPTIYVNSVLRVGIQKILGMWVGKENFLKFDNFDDFRSFEPNFEQNKLIGVLAQKFKYYLVPDAQGRFVISYTNNQSANISVATVGLSDSKLTIETLDTNTGKITERKKYERLVSR